MPRNRSKQGQKKKVEPIVIKHPDGTREIVGYRGVMQPGPKPYSPRVRHKSRVRKATLDKIAEERAEAEAEARKIAEIEEVREAATLAKRVMRKNETV